MEIKYNNRGLLHAYQKHGVTKDQIELSLASGIEKRIRDKVNDSIIIFTIFIIESFDSFAIYSVSKNQFIIFINFIAFKHSEAI